MQREEQQHERPALRPVHQGGAAAWPQGVVAAFGVIGTWPPARPYSPAACTRSAERITAE
jgi:hypothetical protein